MNIWIIEDEQIAARRLEKMVLDIDPSLHITKRLDSIVSTLNYIEKHSLPDLIFLDIHLADGSSFEIFNHTRIDKPIIFTTAYDQYAIQAFKVRAIDYLLKPIKKNELAQALKKFREWGQPLNFDYQELARTLKQEAAPQRFLIKTGQKIRLIDVEDAAYFFTENKITFIVDHQGRRFSLDHSLEKLEEMLVPSRFFRINRQFIINISAISEMIAYSKSRVKLELSPPCKYETIVSTERSPHFKRWLTGEL